MDGKFLPNRRNISDRCMGFGNHFEMGIRMTTYVWKDGVGTKRKPRKRLLPRIINGAFQASIGLALAFTALVAYHEHDRAQREAVIQRILAENGGVFVVPPPPPVSFETSMGESQ